MMRTIKKIGTHDGIFHCDEVLGCYMLKLLYPSAKIVRSRDMTTLNSCDIVLDVGDVYNPEIQRYDHHHKSFNHSMSSILPGKKYDIKLSSAGLIFCHFGKEIIKKVMKNLNDDDLDFVFDRTYEDFVQEIDGIDNGVPMFSSEPMYNIHTDVCSRVKSLNKAWNQEDYNEFEAFQNAMNLVGKEFEEKIRVAAEVLLPAQFIVKEAIDNRFNVHPSGKIIKLTKFCPWTNFLFTLEKTMNLNDQLQYVIYSDHVNNWRVQSVPVHPRSFVLRTPLKFEWRGLRNEELSKISNIDGCIFVHSSGFIGGNKTTDGAIKMAEQSLCEN